MYSRKDKTENPSTKIGSTGDVLWLMEEDISYGGNHEMFRNFMFYFYAMTFVMADDENNYADTEHLAYERKSYPGLHILYDVGVGASPKDHYYVYYEPETHRMAWLRYKFTLVSDEE